MEETKKVCFKCGRTLPLDEFYKHPRMGDGHLNKCKDCTRNDTRIQYDRNIKDPSFIEKERVRGRDKYRRYKYGSTTNISDFQKEKRKLYPQCRSAKQIIGIKTDEGIELHHWNYNLNTSVILLPRNIHHRLHNRITLDLQSGIYLFNGVPLDTIEKHLAIIKDVCDSIGYDFSQIKVI